MSKRLLWGMVIVLLVTNIASIIILSGKEEGTVDKLTEEANIPEEVANVGGEAILAEEWMEQLRVEYGKSFLKELINQKVVFKLAEENNITINEKLLERELAIVETASGIMTGAEREKKREQWKEAIRYELYLDELLTRDIVISDNEINELYTQKPERFNFSKSYQISQIMVQDQSEANNIINELNNGASFDDLAKKYSIDQYTKEKGGYLGYFPEDNTYLQDIYYSTLASMDEGTFSDPFQTTEGTIILYLHHILPEIELEFADVKNHIKRILAQERLPYQVSAELLWDELDVTWIYGE